MKNKNYKLYNVMFPIWLLWLFPITWIYIIVANFIIDSTVILLLSHINQFDSKEIYKKTIIKTYLFGFIADIIGALFLLAFYYISNSFEALETIASNLIWNPFSSFISFLIVLSSTIISSLIIYFLNYKFTFTKTSLSKEEIKKMALQLAIITAPYLFFFTNFFIIFLLII